MLLLTVIVIGLAAGWVAHVLVGRGRHNDWTVDLIVGLAGSLLAGLVVSVIAGDGVRLRLSGLLGSIAGAVILLSIWELVSPPPSRATHRGGSGKRRR